MIFCMVEIVHDTMFDIVRWSADKWWARGSVRGVRLVSFVMMADLYWITHIKVMKEGKREGKYGVLYDKESLR